jgi:transcriptional regulator GlxA family with amidase domain
MIRAGAARVYEYVRASTVQRRHALFREAREVIARRFSDPDLALATVAHEIATSRRQLQRAFAEAGRPVRQGLPQAPRRAAVVISPLAGSHRRVTRVLTSQ